MDICLLSDSRRWDEHWRSVVDGSVRMDGESEMGALRIATLSAAFRSRPGRVAHKDITAVRAAYVKSISGVIAIQRMPRGLLQAAQQRVGVLAQGCAQGSPLRL